MRYPLLVGTLLPIKEQMGTEKEKDPVKKRYCLVGIGTIPKMKWALF